MTLDPNIAPLTGTDEGDLVVGETLHDLELDDELEEDEEDEEDKEDDESE